MFSKALLFNTVTLALVLSLGCTHTPDESTPAPTQAEPSISATEVKTEAPKAQPTVVESTPLPPDVPWHYQGLLGPDQWAQIRPEYQMCQSGKNQSPVDLNWTKPIPGGKLDMKYHPAPLRIQDTGRSLQIIFSPGSTLSTEGVTYELKTAQFHSPSEHTLSGNKLPLEWQFVHESAQGEILIASFFAIEGPQDHPEWAKILAALPPTKNYEMIAVNEELLPKNLIPAILNHYHYSGSLTTPPCTEGVKWLVMNTPVRLSRSQLMNLRKIYDGNARPTQPLNGRKTPVHSL